jgi:hypothetical protein
MEAVFFPNRQKLSTRLQVITAIRQQSSYLQLWEPQISNRNFHSKFWIIYLVQCVRYLALLLREPPRVKFWNFNVLKIKRTWQWCKFLFVLQYCLNDIEVRLGRLSGVCGRRQLYAGSHPIRQSGVSHVHILLQGARPHSARRLTLNSE